MSPPTRAHDPVRIVHLPTATGGHPLGLSRAERALGFRSDVVDFAPGSLAYAADRVFDLSRLGTTQRAAVRLRFLADAARTYDVFHFNAGAPAIALRTQWGVFTELPLLKRLGKTLVVTWQGCDVRPQAACHFCDRTDCAEQDPWRPRYARALLKYADRAVYLNPDLGRYLPGATFLPYANVDVASLAPRALSDRQTVVVAHAPTYPRIKGTEHVVAAVQRLREEGFDVELDLIEGVAHSEAFERIARADVLVDQLHLGWYGGVAVEAMALGRPVVCFINEAENPFGAELPIARADPATLKDVLAGLLRDRDRRAALAESSRAFALREHDPQAIARRYYEGLVPFPGASLAGPAAKGARPSGTCGTNARSSAATTAAGACSDGPRGDPRPAGEPRPD
jgi:glycosyltransferase involved in cell wall biosynthesis